MNWNISLKDARRGELIHDKEIVRVRDKAIRPSQATRVALVIIEVPWELIDKNKNIWLFIDIMHANKIQF